eukprot:362134_1
MQSWYIQINPYNLYQIPPNYALYYQIYSVEPQLAGKITGMLIDAMNENDINNLLNNPTILRNKINEAIVVLKNHNAQILQLCKPINKITSKTTTKNDKLYYNIYSIEPQLAGRITAMLIDAMNEQDIQNLLNNPTNLRNKINEAIAVLKNYQYNLYMQ